MRLYHCPDARSFRAIWTLEELGLSYDLKMLPFPPRVFAKDYLGLNPLGTIHGGWALTLIDTVTGVAGAWIGTSEFADAAGLAAAQAYGGYAGSIPGVNEILRRQGFLEGIWTLKRDEVLSPGQAEEIDRVCAAYPHLNDDEFVAAHLEDWLKP